MNRSTATNGMRLLLAVALLWGMLPVAQGQQGL
jgi:hypothetical protein